MWRPNDEAERWEAPPGVAPWRELSDQEFAALADQHPGLERFFDHVSERGGKKPATSEAVAESEG